MFDGHWRSMIETGTRPVGEALRRTGLTADQLTASGLVIAGGAAVAVGSGHLGLGLGLFVGSAIPDLLDGAIAKASGTSSTRGAFFDSTADRVSDALILGGIAWYLASQGGVGNHAALLPFAVLGTSTAISYMRAKAESLGYQAKGGLMERAERIIALCIGLLFSVLLVPILWLMLVLTGITCVQRFAKVWKQASEALPPAALLTRAERIGRPARPARVSADRGDTASRWAARRAERLASRPNRPSRGSTTVAERWQARRNAASSGDRIERPRRRPSTRP